jgi:cytidine deaminase
MKEEIIIKSKFAKYPNFDSLPDSDKQLVSAAISATENAYAPYSKFNVGAALIDTDGNIVKGNNQENAAYPSGMCAERVAIFAAFANNPNIVVTALAVIASTDNELVPAPPCGSCRQTILEMETRQDKPIRVIIAYNKGIFLVANSVEDLLPLSFTRNYLKD